MAAASSSAAGTYISSDFDQTLTPFKSDLISDLVSVVPNASDAIKNPPKDAAGFMEYLNTLVKEMREKNVGKTEIEKVLKEKQHLEDGAAAAVKAVTQKGATFNVVTGSFDTLVKLVLDQEGVGKQVHCVLGNRAWFDANGKMQWRPRHGEKIDSCPTGCRLLCKRLAIKQFEEAHKVKPKKRIVLGDGDNDYCGMVGLSAGDVALCKSQHLFERVKKANPPCQVVKIKCFSEITKYV